MTAQEYAASIRPDSFIETFPGNMENAYSIDQIEAAFLAGAQSGWVKVTPETMPEPGNSVIVAYQFGVGECRFYTGKFINLVMDCEMPGVTHWMPLPSKPII